LSVKELEELVSMQKQQALSMPVFIFGSEKSVGKISGVLRDYQDIFGRSEVFSVHQGDKDTMETVLCNSIIRTIAVYFFKSDKVYQKLWYTSKLLEQFQNMPHVDFYALDISKLKGSEQQVIDGYNVVKTPSVLIFRAGHVIERIIPEFQTGTDVANQLKLISDEQQLKFIAKQAEKGYSNIEELERQKYEERMREKEVERLRKENQEKIQYMNEVKRKIEQDKRERMRKK